MNVVVIGASRGLGLALCRKLLANSHHVIATIRDDNNAILELRTQYSDQFTPLHADITNESDMASVAKHISDMPDKVDAVVISAGVLTDNDRKLKLHEADIDDVRLTFETNIIGPIIVVKHLLPHMSPGGQIFIVTSEGTSVSSVGTWVPAYALSKTAATKISGILNASTDKIDCYSVHPGRMNTDMGHTTAQIEADESAEGFLHLINRDIKLNREKWYIDYLGQSLPM